MLETVIWIGIALAVTVWFFSLLEGWADIGPVDADDPEDP